MYIVKISGSTAGTPFGGPRSFEANSDPISDEDDARLAFDDQKLSGRVSRVELLFGNPIAGFALLDSKGTA